MKSTNDAVMDCWKGTRRARPGSIQLKFGKVKVIREKIVQRIKRRVDFEEEARPNPGAEGDGEVWILAGRGAAGADAPRREGPGPFSSFQILSFLPYLPSAAAPEGEPRGNLGRKLDPNQGDYFPSNHCFPPPGGVTWMSGKSEIGPEIDVQDDPMGPRFQVDLPATLERGAVPWPEAKYRFLVNG